MSSHQRAGLYESEKITRLLEEFRQGIDWDARFVGQNKFVRSLFHNAAARLAMCNLALRIPGAHLQKVHMIADGMTKGVREFVVEIPGSACFFSIHGAQTRQEIEHGMALRIFGDENYAPSFKIEVEKQENVEEFLKDIPFVEHKVERMQSEFDRLWLDLQTELKSSAVLKRRSI